MSGRQFHTRSEKQLAQLKQNGWKFKEECERYKRIQQRRHLLSRKFLQTQPLLSSTLAAGDKLKRYSTTTCTRSHVRITASVPLSRDMSSATRMAAPAEKQTTRVFNLIARTTPTTTKAVFAPDYTLRAFCDAPTSRTHTHRTHFGQKNICAQRWVLSTGVVQTRKCGSCSSGISGSLIITGSVGG